MNIKNIRIIKGCSADREGLLHGRIVELEKLGFRILFDDITPNSTWPWTAGSVEDRSTQLNHALLESESDAIMFARGGYGASDLLDLVPWTKLPNAKQKPIIGFSDVCAIQSALYALNGRQSIHGPMPATVTWNRNGTADTNALISLLTGTSQRGSLSLSRIAGHRGDSGEISGKLFGGCLSVLTSLIGTRYFPRTLSDHILFFEDIGENPGRILRALNQWRHAGFFYNVRAIILGAFSDLGGDLPTSAPILLEEIGRRFQVPIFSSLDFGHISPNMPIVIGATAKISSNTLEWSISSNNHQHLS